MKIAGIILAGGQARRMGGGDKGLLPLGDTTLLGRVIRRLSPQVEVLALNANGDPTRFATFGLPVISDSIADYPGPLAGVLAGMDWAAAQGYDSIVTAAADTPFFPENLVQALLLARESAQTPLARAETPRIDGGYDRHPTFGLWDVALRDDLRVALADGLRKVMAWTDPKGCASVVFDATVNHDPFFNVNTPDDLELARLRVTS